MSMQKLLRGVRLTLARLPHPRMRHVIDSPAVPVRDPWPGDAARGARLLRGEMEVGVAARLLRPGEWGNRSGSVHTRAAAHGFAWLGDLRALGSDAARMRARQLVADWIASPDLDPIATRPDVAGARLAAWLGHYDFFAASADDGFRQKLMMRLTTDARKLSASLPNDRGTAGALTALKGLIAAGVALPEHKGLLARGLRLLSPELAMQVLPDGCHVQRSPATHLRVLRDLIEMRGLLQAAGVTVPAALTSAIEKLAPALRVQRHADGGLALFNGTQEEAASLIDLVLAQAGRGGRASSSLPDGGFQRAQAGKTLLLIDAGMPPAPGLDSGAHAGTLAFEMSVGRERLIVNCGAAPAAADTWRDALRATAAHSTLVIADTNSSEIHSGGGLGRRPSKVEVLRQEDHGAHWLEMSHDGYGAPFGAVHLRRIYLAESGDDVRGEDIVEASEGLAYAVRFHLHPAVKVQQEGAVVLLQLVQGGTWRLRAEGGHLSVEDSLYLGGRELRATRQVVLNVAHDGVQQLKWAITRMG